MTFCYFFSVKEEFQCRFLSFEGAAGADAQKPGRISSSEPMRVRVDAVATPHAGGGAAGYAQVLVVGCV